MAQLTPQQRAELTIWVETYTQRTDELSERTAAAILALYVGRNFYDPRVVAEIVAAAASISHTADLIAAGLAAHYLSMVMTTTTGAPVPVPNVDLPPIRNGVDLREVFERPIKQFRRHVSEGVAPERAFERAMDYASQLVDGNIRLAQREQSREVMDKSPVEIGITGYRRVVHPELSEGGSCGLCIVASHMVYKKGELMPIHDRCKCTVAPIIGELDPGNSLNNLDLGDLYGDADSTLGKELKKIRYKVNNHGEWGPVLDRRGNPLNGDTAKPAAA